MSELIGVVVKVVCFDRHPPVFGRGVGGLVNFFLWWGVLLSVYLSRAILPLGGCRRSDSLSHAHLHATLNGMENIGCLHPPVNSSEMSWY